MVVPLTPKPTRKAEALTKVSPTITSRREEDVVVKKWPKSWLCCANDILETKANDGSTAAKAPAIRTNPNTKEAPTALKPHTHPSHERDGHQCHVTKRCSISFFGNSKRKKGAREMINTQTCAIAFHEQWASAPVVQETFVEDWGSAPRDLR